MLSTAEQDARLDAIASLLARLAPDGAESLEFAYRAVGSSFEHAGLPFTARNIESLLPSSGVYPLVRELRSLMHVDGDGTWLEMHLKLRLRPAAAPEWEVRFRSVDEITFMDDVPPAAAAEELRTFPQAPHRVPEWIAELAAVQDAADRFDPDTFSPQPEPDLVAALPADLAELFDTARARLRDQLPEGPAGRFLVGELADGCWSVLHLAPAWLAARMDGGACVEQRAFTDPAAAVAFAAGAVLAEAGAEVNSSVLRGAGVLNRTTDRRNGVDAWRLTSGDGNGARQLRRSIAAERPRGADARERRFFALSPLDNRPGGYFVVQPGQVPAEGDFVSTHQIFQWHIGSSLPKAGAPEPSPVEDVVLEPGTELDTYDFTSTGRLFTIGTPFEWRQLDGYPEDVPHRFFRVLRPLRATPLPLSGRTLYRPGDWGPKRLPDARGRGFGLPHSIIDHVESGDLTEISGPGGDPVPLRDDWDADG
ncbi:hypothetical protein [Actinomadura geliboluensis]|uniref:hypothetical protein n=1 Tax=Actinomadura geliboluensis TaxID=882440 RepID=UPI00261D47DE|nr:hypothetical protein [Actinomadura geliboluensis]